MTYPAISKKLHQKLKQIVPSKFWGLEYYPCRVMLNDGRQIDRVYVVEQEPYIRIWGVYPGDDPAKASIPIQEVADLDESPSRLPPKMANKLYEEGESGMGYTIFTVVFRGGLKQAYVSGNAVDFIALPEGRTNRDIKDILPHKGRDSSGLRNALDYYWCIYSGVE